MYQILHATEYVFGGYGDDMIFNFIILKHKMSAINYVRVVSSSFRIIHKTCHTKDVKISCNQLNFFLLTSFYSNSESKKTRVIYLLTSYFIGNWSAF